jgi:hypothetical protein
MDIIEMITSFLEQIFGFIAEFLDELFGGLFPQE